MGSSDVSIALGLIALSVLGFAQGQTQKCRMTVLPRAADTVAYLPCAVEQTARLRPKPEPIYPAVMLRAELEGRVVVQLVLDKAGRVESGTVETLKSTHDEFTASVREVVRRWRGAPARLQQRPVRQWVEYQFVFRLKCVPDNRGDAVQNTPSSLP